LESETDIGPSLSYWFSNAVFKSLRSRINSGGTYENLLREIIHVADSVAEVWVDLLLVFMDCVLSQCSQQGIAEVCVVSRDATPLLPVGLKLANLSHRGVLVSLVELNRAMFGIPDKILETATDFDKTGSIAPSKSSQSAYLLEQFGSRTKCYVDIECYGTIIREIYKVQDLGFKPWCLLFASNNPYLSGFLNSLIEYANMRREEIPYKFMWVLGDTLEAFPKPYKHVSLVERDGNHLLLTKRTTLTYHTFALGLYASLYKRTMQNPVEQIDPIREIRKLRSLFLSNEQVQSPIILPHALPEWASAWDFLNHWDVGFIPPRMKYVE
jgi:hypothetical protein